MGLSRKRILVAGGAGFLGSHLCAKLLYEGNTVICADNYCTGRVRNITKLMPNPLFSVIRQDINCPFHLEVDEIFNLACPASPSYYQDNPVQTAKTNVIGAINLLELAKRTKAKIVQASTSEVYGDPAINPQSEDYRGNVSTVGPRACYDEGKRLAETLFSDYRRQHGVRTKIMRIFNTYGPHMSHNDGRVVSNFIVQALRDRPITLYGDGSQTRSFCYVDDLIEGFVSLMAAGDEIVGPMNFGNPHEISIAELAVRVIAMTGSTSKIVLRPLPQHDPTRRCPDIRLAQTQLGWGPVIDLDGGLARTIDYFVGSLDPKGAKGIRDRLIPVC